MMVAIVLSLLLWQHARENNMPPWEAAREINAKIALEWAQKQFVARVYTLFYFLHDLTNP